MRKHTINRPDRETMTRLLAENQMNSAGTVLRLSWLAGLSREEITGLTWGQVSFQDAQLYLPDRSVPMEEELSSYLQRLWEKRGSGAWVLFSERTAGPMQPESISRLARQALDAAGQKHVRLMDLRHDWILRQLESQDWATVARISGVEVPALQARFGALVAEHPPEARPKREAAGQVDEFKLWKVLQAERSTPAGLALWLTWQMGLSAREIVDLTWDRVSLEDGVVRLADRTVPITNTVGRILEETWAARLPGDDVHVVLTAQTRSPLDLPRLSRLTRSALIRGGLEDVQLRQLRKNERRENEDAMLLGQVMESGCISRGTVCQLLGVSKTAAHARLNRLLEQKKLVRIGAKYYLPGTVVPPEEHSTVIREYLTREGFAYRKDIAQLLHIDSRQCTPILQRLVAEGELEQHQQKYYLHASSE